MNTDFNRKLKSHNYNSNCSLIFKNETTNLREK